MNKIKREIPFVGNEMYYDGLKNSMSGSIYSMLGVFLYAFLLRKISFESLSSLAFCIFFAWIFFCGVTFITLRKRTNRVIFYSGKITYCPCLAIVFRTFLYIAIGAYCSLLFDAMIAMDNPPYDVDAYKNILMAFMWSSLCLFFSFFGFCNFAVKDIKNLEG